MSDKLLRSSSVTSSSQLSGDCVGALHSEPALDEYGRNSIIFTGPDGLYPHRVSRIDAMFIGIGMRSIENTEALSYLFRAAPGQSFPKAKRENIGEPGWDVWI